MPTLLRFEVHAEDPRRAMRFYSEVFEWKFTAVAADYWAVTTVPDGQPGMNGGLLQRRGAAPQEGQPVNAFVCTIEVPDIDGYLERALQNGGSVALAKMAVPGMAWVAYAKDTEGNVFGLLQLDSSAR